MACLPNTGAGFDIVNPQNSYIRSWLYTQFIHSDRSICPRRLPAIIDSPGEGIRLYPVSHTAFRASKWQRELTTQLNCFWHDPLGQRKCYGKSETKDDTELAEALIFFWLLHILHVDHWLNSRKFKTLEIIKPTVPHFIALTITDVGKDCRIRISSAWWNTALAIR